ncbi:Paraquatinducible protein A [Leishmania braziliensis]|nr:Paraquatinducible protein A [Leishmania braziliensis]
MAPYSQCLTTALLLSTLNLTSVPIPSFNESLLGVHAFNLTCFDVYLRGLGTNWTGTTSYLGTTEGGTFSCRTNLTALSYAGTVLADVAVYPSKVELTRTVEDPMSEFTCITNASSVTACNVNISLLSLRADPPSGLIDLLLREAQTYMKSHLTDYVCKVMVPRLQSSILNQTYPYTPEPRPENRTAIAVTDSPFMRAVMNILNRVDVAGLQFFVRSQQSRINVVIYHPGGTNIGYAGNFVPSPLGESALDWGQRLVDAYILGDAPHPFPLYGLPGMIGDALVQLNTSKTLFASLDVDFSIAASANNWVTIYLTPGVSIANLRIQAPGDGLGSLLTHELSPVLENVINAKLARVLAAFAGNVSSGVSNSNTTNNTVTFFFGEDTHVRDSPLMVPLICVGAVGALVGGLLVYRNVRQHRNKPVLSSATGTPLSTFRIVAEDVFLVGGVLLCVLLFTASNTMTGATVVLGSEMRTYAFSLSNTITDLWQAGLIPLSICVLVFSGVYPYVKMLSIVGFTVWAHRPTSRILRLIDCLGKLSLIDTFALMVMVSGLDIPNIADVRIHLSFYLFMYATLLSIAIGNYAALLWRAGTTLRNEGISVANTSSNSTFAEDAEPMAVSSVVQSRQDMIPIDHTMSPVDDAMQLRSGENSVSRRRQVARYFFCIPSLFMFACSIPAWVLPSFRYQIGGFARLLTPVSKSLSLWILSSLGNRSDAYDILLVAFFTILIAPCLYVALYPKCRFLASWCGADVLVLACVIGLMQLQQFVRFVLGEEVGIFYTAHASLLWPMFLLSAASVLVWVYIVRDILHVSSTHKSLRTIPSPA